MELSESIDQAAASWAKWFADRLRAGQAVWQNNVERFGSMPLTSLDARDVPLSGANALVLAQSMWDRQWDDPRFFTRDQLVSMGGRIRAGAERVEAPFIRVNGPDGALAEAPELVVYSLYNATDIEGLPAWRRPERHWSLETLAARLLPSFGVDIVHDQVDQAFFSAVDGKVHMPPPGSFSSVGDYVGVAIHELAHGSRGELGRVVEGSPGDVSYAREELRAEIASMHLSIALGIPHNVERHRGFAGAWADDLEAHPLELFRAAKDGERMAALVLRHVRDLQALGQLVGEVSPAVGGEGKGGVQWVVDRSVYVVYGERDKTEFESVEDAAAAFVAGALIEDAGVVRLDFGPDLPAAGRGTVVGQVVFQAAAELGEPGLRRVWVDDAVFGAALTAAELAVSQAKVAEVAPAVEGSDAGKAADAVPRRTARAAARKANYAARARDEFPHRQAILQVPYADRREAYRLGALYFEDEKIWFVPRGVNIEPLKRWTLEAQQALALRNTPSEGELIAEFERFVIANNGAFKEGHGVIADGDWHHIRATDNRNPSNHSLSYLLDLTGGKDRDGTPNGKPVGVVMNRYSGVKSHWHPDVPSLSPEDLARINVEAQQRAEARDRATQARYEEVAQESMAIWARAMDGAHGYYDKKQVGAHGCRVIRGAALLEYSAFKGDEGKSIIRSKELYALVPVRDLDGKLWALQAISEDGKTKAFMSGGRKKGCFALLDAQGGLATELPTSGLVGFTEGFATGASVQEHSAVRHVAVCFDAGNLEAVAQLVAQRRAEGQFTGISPVICADNDQFFMERAFGLLAKVGVVAHGPADGPGVSVTCGAGVARRLPTGEVMLDGAWHQGPAGRYRVETWPDAEMADCVGKVRVEIELASGEKESMTGANRGLEAGRVAAKALGGVLAVPQFDQLRGRPTDWNDLAVARGDVGRQIDACVRERRVEVGRGASGDGRGR